jgi:hypothetical protein
MDFPRVDELRSLIDPVSDACSRLLDLDEPEATEAQGYLENNIR